jgi:hypothetical protein
MAEAGLSAGELAVRGHGSSSCAGQHINTLMKMKTNSLYGAVHGP